MINKKQMRQAFNQAATEYDQHAKLQQTVADDLIQRLSWLKVDPKHIVDLGSGTGYCLTALQARYPQATVIAIDIAEHALQVNQASHAAKENIHYLCGDMMALPLQPNAVDLVISNLVVHWEQDIQRSFANVERILAPGGAFLFSTLGMDTLHECRQAWQAVDEDIHVHPFLDMHDVGDALVQAQFSDPVMDTDCITMMFDSVKQLAKTLKGLGVQNTHEKRSAGLTSRKRWQQFEAQYEQCRGEQGLPATYEVIYGIAWKPLQQRRRRSIGEVRLDQIKRSIAKK